MKHEQYMHQSTTTLALLRGLLALQTLHLGSPLSLDLSLSPRQPTVFAVIRLSNDAGLFGGPTNLPVRLTIHVARTQLRAGLSIGGLNVGNHGAILSRRDYHIRLSRILLDDTGNSDSVQLPAGGSIPGRWELPFLLETDTNILAVRVPFRIEVIPDIAGLGGVDGVVSSKRAVLAGEPFRSALFEDNASGDDVFSACALRAETLSGGVPGVSVCCSLGSVRGVSNVREREEFRERKRW